MKKATQFLLLTIGLSSASADTVIFSENFDSTAWNAIADPAAGIKVAIATNLTTNNGTAYVPTSGTPQNIQARANGVTNAYADSILLSDGVNSANDPLGGATGNLLHGNSSLGLKASGMVYWDLTSYITAGGKDTISFSFDWSTGLTNNYGSSNLIGGLYSTIPTYNEADGSGANSTLSTTGLIAGSDFAVGASPQASNLGNQEGHLSITNINTSEYTNVFLVFQKSGYEKTAHFDNVSVTIIPEPANYALLIGSFALSTLMLHRRR